MVCIIMADNMLPDPAPVPEFTIGKERRHHFRKLLQGYWLGLRLNHYLAAGRYMHTRSQKLCQFRLILHVVPDIPLRNIIELPRPIDLYNHLTVQPEIINRSAVPMADKITKEKISEVRQQHPISNKKVQEFCIYSCAHL